MRVILGFLLSPLVVPLYFLCWGFILGEKPTLGEWGDSAIGFLLTTGPYAYFAALVVGALTYLFLKSKDLLAWYVFTFLGGLIGALLVVLLLLAERERILLMGGMPGALSGFVFWWIAIKERGNEAGIDLE